MLASSVPMATTSDVSPFPRGFAWRATSPPAMEFTDILHAQESGPTTPSPSAARARASPTATPTRKAAPAPASSSSSSSSSARPNMTASSTITLAMLRPHFEEPLAQVAQHFGICVTLLKKICRRHGIARWPHRQISGLRKSIASMEHAIGYFEGARRESYAAQLNKQRAKLELLLHDPTAPSLLSPSAQPARGAFPDEDEDERDSMGSPIGAATVYAPAYYQSPPSMRDVYHSPVQYEAARTPSPVLPPLQGVLRPEFPLEYQQTQPPSQQQQQQQQQQFQYAQPRPREEQSYFRRGDCYAEPRGVPEIPPLRMEPKPVLPPISSLRVPASGGPRASW